MKAYNERMNKVYCLNVQYKLLLVQKKRSQRVNKGQVCIVTIIKINNTVSYLANEAKIANKSEFDYSL